MLACDVREQLVVCRPKAFTDQVAATFRGWERMSARALAFARLEVVGAIARGTRVVRHAF